MNMDVQYPTQPVSPVPESRLWFGTAAAAAAWFIHEMALALISSRACTDGNADWGPLSTLGVRILLAIVTIVLGAVAVLSGLTSLGSWRRLSDRRRLIEDEGFGRQHFMALTGILSGVVFTLGIIYDGIPLLLVDICTNAH